MLVKPVTPTFGFKAISPQGNLKGMKLLSPPCSRNPGEIKRTSLPEKKKGHDPQICCFFTVHTPIVHGMQLPPEPAPCYPHGPQGQREPRQHGALAAGTALTNCPPPLEFTACYSSVVVAATAAASAVLSGRSAVYSTEQKSQVTIWFFLLFDACISHIISLSLPFFFILTYSWTFPSY